MESKQKMTVSIDLRAVIIVLLLVIGGMLAVWKPWNNTVDNARTISETGETTITATPDEYSFSPTFEAEAEDSSVAKDEVAKTVNAVVEALKELGVSEDDLKLNAYGYDDYNYWQNDDDSFTASAYLQIVISEKDLADKVQDYLGTTDAEGQLTANAQFSEEMTKQLETQAREEAIEDAKTKAEQTAGLLDAKVGKAITISEGSGFDGYPLFDYAIAEQAADGSTRSSLPVLPGQNEFTYTVSVTFALI